MRFRQEIEINLPREKVIELFDNPDNLKKWQPGLVSFKPLDGVAGQPGGKSRLKYMMGKREIEMIETITARNLPDEFSGTYEAKGVWNEVKNYFHETESGTTRWVTENEFRFTGFMKLVAMFAGGSFRKESYKFMVNFKKFAEKMD